MYLFIIYLYTTFVLLNEWNDNFTLSLANISSTYRIMSAWLTGPLTAKKANHQLFPFLEVYARLPSRLQFSHFFRLLRMTRTCVFNAVANTLESFNLKYILFIYYNMENRLMYCFLRLSEFIYDLKCLVGIIGKKATIVYTVKLKLALKQKLATS